ncbi:two-component system sensor histidine kinase DesK [Glycomyces artemisiae]|uniref:Two-component system sensor histidine kinase DesK n=1 Tax=Glycomyces artemisiae TaxID=1076443 RepID=A0A2T0UEZ0_9ACTN|nr:two-component system sensor histidine kinase DesK [Glycomyces artemisiae]
MRSARPAPSASATAGRAAGWLNHRVTPEPAPARDLRRLRTYTFFTVIGSGPLALAMAALFLAGADDGVRPLAAGAAVGSVALCTAGLALHWHGQGPWRRRLLWIASLALLFAGVAAEAASGEIGPAWGAPAGLIAAEGALLWSLPGRRSLAVLLGTAAAGALSALAMQLGYMNFGALLTTAVLVPSIAVGIVCQLWHYRVAQELEQARGLAADLAVAEERLRFAAELHDVQGGHLQAIMLKAQVARRFRDTDPELAAAEVQAVEELAREALRDMRAVVGGYRKTALADEIDSAARLLKSAGVEASVPDKAPDLDEDTERLLGLLVREATTNLIRHAEPTSANVSIVEVDAQVTVTVVNDGAPEATEGGNGLSMLAKRFDEAGGSVEHALDNGEWTIRGTLPKPVVPRPRQAPRAATRARRR